MSEAVIRQRLIRLSCAKLLAFKKSSEGLRRSLHVLTVLKHAHSDEARFEPECSDLLYSQQQQNQVQNNNNNRLVVIIETAQPQRISPSIPSPPLCPLPSSPSVAELAHHIVPTSESIDIENDINESNNAMETDDEEDGTSMARKRKNHAISSMIIDYSEKRHCDVDSGPTSSSIPITTSSSSISSAGMSLESTSSSNN